MGELGLASLGWLAATEVLWLGAGLLLAGPAAFFVGRSLLRKTLTQEGAQAKGSAAAILAEAEADAARIRDRNRELEKSGQAAADRARKEAEGIVQEAQVRARDEMVTRREELERQIEGERREVREMERRASKREESLDRKEQQLQKRDKQLSDQEQKLQNRQSNLDKFQTRLETQEKEVSQRLLEVAGLTEEEARDRLFERLDQELGVECARFIEQRVQTARDTAEQQAREIVLTAMQRTATDHCSASTVSTVDVPNDEMKGRIIGREGRNIRAFEKVTGVDVIVDDTPGVIVVSAFDGVRREIARRAMQQLVQDGRVHPSRIEEVVARIKKEMDHHIRETGRKALMEVDLHRMHNKLVDLLGRLKFRTSYGQNVLDHLIEASHLAGAMAAEMRLDVKMAKRACLLHDIGKAVDHEVEGGHPAIGADIARRCGEHKWVVNAIASHHNDVPMQSVYSVITQICDALSAGRPGARRETFERYIERLERLEDVASSFPGVSQAYAIQAGREVRVLVNHKKIDDRLAMKLARDIAAEIERELTYPGEVRVTLLRETRVTEYAR